MLVIAVLCAITFCIVLFLDAIIESYSAYFCTLAITFLCMFLFCFLGCFVFREDSGRYEYVVKITDENISSKQLTEDYYILKHYGNTYKLQDRR